MNTEHISHQTEFSITITKNKHCNCKNRHQSMTVLEESHWDTLFLPPIMDCRRSGSERSAFTSDPLQHFTAKFNEFSSSTKDFYWNSCYSINGPQISVRRGHEKKQLEQANAIKLVSGQRDTYPCLKRLLNKGVVKVCRVKPEVKLFKNQI